MIVPEAPETFLVEFLPAFVADLGALPDPEPARSAAAEARRGRRGPSNAGIAVRVVDVGQWTLRWSARALAAAQGIAGDVALQISLRAVDFTPLVIEPMRRAFEALDAGGAPARQLWARSLWARLGRFDDETADLLRRQEGGVLVRAADGGTSRHLALTPGLRSYSLDSAECYIDCELEALYSVQAKRKNPLDLFYEGQIRISGDAQIALAMAGLFL